MFKKIILFLLSISFLQILAMPSYSSIEDFGYVPRRYMYRFVEEYYLAYRENLYRETSNLLANIHYLEMARKLAINHKFAPLVQAMAIIETAEQWQKYKALLYFRINLLLVKSYIALAGWYDKPNIYFFNLEYEKEIRKGFSIAKDCYLQAIEYWKIAKSYAFECWKLEYIPLEGMEIDSMVVEVYKIVRIYSKQMGLEKVTEYNDYNFNQENQSNFLDYDLDTILKTRMERLEEKNRQLDILKKQYLNSLKK